MSAARERQDNNIATARPSANRFMLALLQAQECTGALNSSPRSKHGTLSASKQGRAGIGVGRAERVVCFIMRMRARLYLCLAPLFSTCAPLLAACAPLLAASCASQRDAGEALIVSGAMVAIGASEAATGGVPCVRNGCAAQTSRHSAQVAAGVAAGVALAAAGSALQ